MRKDSPLERYISILETIAPFEDGLSASELQDVLNLPKATVNRLLNILHDSDLVRIHQARGRSYTLGDRMVNIIQSSTGADWLEAVTKKTMKTLAETTKQSAFISKFDGKKVRSATCFAPDVPVRMYVEPGMIMPLNATATGKAIMAFQDCETIDRVLAQEFESYTDNTKTNIDDIKQELKLVRERGFASEFAEHVREIGTIAYPIFTAPNEVLYAVGLTGAYSRMTEEFDSLCQALKLASEQLSRLLKRSDHSNDNDE